MAFDPDWRALTPSQIETLDRWVGEQAGGLIVIAGPIYSDALAQEAGLSKIPRFTRSNSTAGCRSWTTARTARKNRGRWSSRATEATPSSCGSRIRDRQAPTPGPTSRVCTAITASRGRSRPRPSTALLRPSGSRGRSTAGLPCRSVLRRGRVLYLGSGEMWRLLRRQRGVFRAILHQARTVRFARSLVARLESWRFAGRARPLSAWQYRRRACPTERRSLIRSLPRRSRCKSICPIQRNKT